jgi:ubiquinone/menaquinone biosynthesis C-methylase UbiE
MHSDTEAAYNQWSGQYDSNNNATRDLEAMALKEMLRGKQFQNCLEIGCGTGKNTVFLQTICHQVTGVDLSEKMLKRQGKKYNHPM